MGEIRFVEDAVEVIFAAELAYTVVDSIERCGLQFAGATGGA